MPGPKLCAGCLHWMGSAGCRAAAPHFKAYECLAKNSDPDGPYSTRKEIEWDENADRQVSLKHIRCSTCGGLDRPFYSLIMPPHPTFCKRCFDDPCLWKGTKAELDQLRASIKEERRRIPAQSPLFAFMGTVEGRRPE